jgi:thiamine biosynthesis lipoprotein
VTVVGPSLLWADVLATAAFVRGPVDGLDLVEGLTGYEALVVAGDGALTTTSGLMEAASASTAPAAGAVSSR